MHDMILSKQILDEISKYDDVLECSIEVGELFGIEPDHLLEHLKEISDVNFKILQKESKIKCKCGYKGRAKIVERMHDLVLYECPKCHEVPDVIEGDKLKIVDVKCA